MTSPLKRSQEAVIVVEMLFLLLIIAVLRLLLAPVSRALTSVLALWAILIFTSYLAGEFETAVRMNFGLTLRTQAAFALAYVVYSVVHVVWPWCELLTVRFWMVLWAYLSVVAPLIGLFARRLLRQRVLFVTDNHRDRVSLLRWWGFEPRETIGVDELADWLKKNTDHHGWVRDYELIVLDTADYRTEYVVAEVAEHYFVDFVGISSFGMSGYLFGPYPRLIMSYSLVGVARRLKRVVDLFCSALAILLLGPMFLAVALLIKLTSPGPVFYRHRRLGRNMQDFWLLKFRTMYRDADRRLKDLLEADPELRKEFEASFKLKNDPRITPIGAFLRRTSIDELPQFFNILAGHMSLVGPRPIVQGEVKYYRDYSLLLFRVLPGATGLWQVSGRSETSYQQRVELDTRYVREWTLLWDLRIIVKTIPAVLKRHGAY